LLRERDLRDILSAADMRRGKHKQLGSAAFFAAFGTFASQASAIITFGDPGNNYSTIPCGLGNYLGDFGAYLGTPISSNCLVTAAHITNATSYQYLFNNGTDTTTTYTVQIAATLDDLAIWQIAPSDNATFSIYAPLYSGGSGNEVGQQLIDTGRGVQRGSAVTGGWAWGGNNGPISWGTNTVSAIINGSQEGDSPDLGGNFLNYAFNNNPSDPNECILANYDSGGGVFVDNNGTYQLDGVNSAVDQVYDSNGNPVQAALYDDTGYYYYNSENQLEQITANEAGPLTSYATQISSKLNLVDEVTGVISPANAAAFPVENDGGLLSVYSNLTTGAMTGSGYLVVGSNSTPATLTLARGSGSSSLASLSIAAGSTLDITDTEVIINYGANPDLKATILAYLASGSNNGAWNGTGIISSTAAAAGNYGVALLDGADSIDPDLTSGELEIAYALYGDITLQGVVNGEDFHILASNFGQVVTNGWEDGDFTYSGEVNAQDFSLLAANFGLTADGEDPAIPQSDWAALEAFAAANGLTLNVPEPATGAIALAAGVTLCQRRRRKI
jgi:hypothetical protein